MSADALAFAATLGLPGLVAAIAYFVRQRGDAAAKHAQAERERAEARRLEAEASRAREETTGRVLTAEAETNRAAYRDARADLSRCEEVREELQAALATERAAREDLARTCDDQKRELVQSMAELRGRVFELERRSLRPNGGA